MKMKAQLTWPLTFRMSATSRPHQLKMTTTSKTSSHSELRIKKLSKKQMIKKMMTTIITQKIKSRLTRWIKTKTWQNSSNLPKSTLSLKNKSKKTKRISMRMITNKTRTKTRIKTKSKSKSKMTKKIRIKWESKTRLKQVKSKCLTLLRLSLIRLLSAS